MTSVLLGQRAAVYQKLTSQSEWIAVKPAPTRGLCQKSKRKCAKRKRNLWQRIQNPRFAKTNLWKSLTKNEVYLKSMLNCAIWVIFFRFHCVFSSFVMAYFWSFLEKLRSLYKVTFIFISDVHFYWHKYNSIMQEDTRSNAAEHILKILVVHGADREDPVDVSILFRMWQYCKACTYADGGYFCPQPGIPTNTKLHLWGVPETFPGPGCC